MLGQVEVVLPINNGEQVKLHLWYAGKSKVLFPAVSWWMPCRWHLLLFGGAVLYVKQMKQTNDAAKDIWLALRRWMWWGRKLCRFYFKKDVQWPWCLQSLNLSPGVFNQYLNWVMAFIYHCRLFDQSSSHAPIILQVLNLSFPQK